MAATVLANIPNAISALLGEWAFSLPLFHLFARLAWPLSAVILAGGFMSRSRSARALAVITTVGWAALFVADSLLLPDLVVRAGMWAYGTGLVATVALWTVRALRRRLTGDAA